MKSALTDRGLRAVCVQLPPGRPLDPARLALGESRAVGALFASSWRTLAGIGSVLDIPLHEGLEGEARAPHVLATLEAIPCTGDLSVPGSGPVALGAIPFDRRAPTRLTVPEVIYGSEPGGTEWVTFVGDGRLPVPRDELRDHLAALAASSPRSELSPVPVVRELRLDVDDRDLGRRVAHALSSIAAGHLQKVVLARSLQIVLEAPVDPYAVHCRLAGVEPTAMQFAFVSGKSSFLGASPELLVRLERGAVTSEPLAGTVRLSGDRAGDAAALEALQRSAKEAHEHRLVVDAVAGALREHCSSVLVPSRARTVRLRDLAHLATRIEGTLRADAGTGVLSLAAALHPTPAVAGSPRQAALALIEAIEPDGRGLYAGPVGWMDSRGDGEMAVAIRSLSISSNRVRALAGAGVVAGSDPTSEARETAVKLATALAGLGLSSSFALDPPHGESDRLGGVAS